MKRIKKPRHMIDGDELIRELEEWRGRITADHRDPIVEDETLEIVEYLVRRLMQEEAEK